MPLGNGEFCFNADGTGLQTFGGNTMAHWAWHSFPLPEGWTVDRVPATGTFQQGRNRGRETRPGKARTIEAARLYVDLKKNGCGLEMLDVGGGLGIDYDGSQTDLNRA